VETAAIAVAVVALLAAFVALGRASAARREAQEAKDDAQRRAAGVLESVDERLEATRKLIALVAGGARLDRDQILEGRLWREVDAREGEKLVAAGAVRLLDVRSPQETALGIIPGAQIIPIDQLEARAREVAQHGQPLLVYCAGGSRSAAACELLSALGHGEVMNLAGGLQSWSGRTVPGSTPPLPAGGR
jgi:rhodanese-related sulfurtransferase